MTRVLLRVKAGAAHTRVGGAYNGAKGTALVVAVTAPPADGHATEAALAAVADAFGVRRREIALVAGTTARDKVVELPEVARGRDTTVRLGELLGVGDAGR